MELIAIITASIALAGFIISLFRSQPITPSPDNPNEQNEFINNYKYQVICAADDTRHPKTITLKSPSRQIRYHTYAPIMAKIVQETHDKLH